MPHSSWPPWLMPVPGKDFPFLGTIQPAGWELPELLWDRLQQGWGVTPLLDWTVVQLTGADRQGFLHNLCTNEVRSLSPGQGTEAFLTDPKGHVVGQVFVLVEEEQLRLVAVPGSSQAVLSHLEYYHIVEDVQFADCSGEQALFLLQGARLPEVLDCWQCPLPLEQPWRHAPVAEQPGWRVAAVDWLPGPGALAVGPAQAAGSFWAWLQEQGAVPVGFDVLEPGRIEQGLPWFGLDITRENLPQESGRTRQAVSFTKGCYVGQETVARLENLGHVNRQVRLLRWDAQTAVPSPGTELRYQDKPAGQVTSAAWHPGWRCPVGLGLVRREAFAPGTPLQSPAGPCQVLLPGQGGGP